MPVVRSHIDRMQAAGARYSKATETSATTAPAATGTVGEADATASFDGVGDDDASAELVSQALKWSIGYLKQRSAEEERDMMTEAAAAQDEAERSARAVAETAIQARLRAAAAQQSQAGDSSLR